VLTALWLAVSATMGGAAGVHRSDYSMGET
jgi:hypothetical protein